MFSCPSCIDSAIPQEYRRVAEELFPPKALPSGQGPALRTAVAFAESLGIGADYKRLLALKKDCKDIQIFLGHFQNNLDLLIQKTWVEKADETRKEKLQNRVVPFITLIQEEEYQKALESFGEILEELAYLFFGAQSSQDDFIDYTMRIDLPMGLFWWYGGKLSGSEGREWAGSVDKDLLFAVLLLGICYLTDF